MTVVWEFEMKVGDINKYAKYQINIQKPLLNFFCYSA